MDAITVIIPVAPQHAALLPDALRSVERQTLHAGVRVIVVWDGDPAGQPAGMGQPWPFLLDVLSTGGGRWSSHARNMALALVNTPFVTFLDADDALTNLALEMLLKGYVMWPQASYVYGDALTVRAEGKLALSPAPEYDRALIGQRNVHVVTALVPTRLARAVGGFDESLRGWEDWEFYMRLAEAGYCGKRLPLPVITYRLHTGMNRSRSNEMQTLINNIRTRHSRLVKGEFDVGCCPDNAGPEKSEAEKLLIEQFSAQQMLTPDGHVPMEYVGNKVAPVTYNVNGRSYAGGQSQRYFGANPADVERLEALGVFRRMPAPSANLQPSELQPAGEEPPLVPPFSDEPELVDPSEEQHAPAAKKSARKSKKA